MRLHTPPTMPAYHYVFTCPNCQCHTASNAAGHQDGRILNICGHYGYVSATPKENNKTLISVEEQGNQAESLATKEIKEAIQNEKKHTFLFPQRG